LHNPFYAKIELNKKEDNGQFIGGLRKIDRRALNDLIADYFAKSANDLNIDNLFYKIQIPAGDSVELLNYLRILGYDSSTLFPGYSGIVKDIKESRIMETIES